MIGTTDISTQAKFPNIPLEPMFAYASSPSSIRLRNVPKRIGDWHITNVYVTVAYPDNTVKTVECRLVGGIYVATIEGCSTVGKVENGLTITACGKDENDTPVVGYVLGKGDVEILSARENVSPGPTVYYVHLLEDEPDQPKNGDMYKKDGSYVVYQDGVENPLGVSQSYVDEQVNLKQDKLTEDQLSSIDQSLYELQTKIAFANNATLYFVSPSYSLSKAILKEKGILAEDGTTWLKEPIAVETGSNVSEIQTGLFQNATKLNVFRGKNITMIWGQAFVGCRALTKVEIPSITHLMGANIFNGCSSLANLTLPKTLASVARMAFNINSFQYVMFEGKTLAEVKAMANYNRWGLAEDKIYTNAFENQLPTVHGDYIEDTNGNKINADRTTYGRTDVWNWVLDNTYVMTPNNSNVARYIPSNTSESGYEIHVYEGSSYPDAYDL